MTAHVNETIVRSFRVRPDHLRDLDAIVRQRAQEIEDTLKPEYVIRRRDNYSFSTTDIEQVLQEHNGKETAITSLDLRIDSEPKLVLNVRFSDGIQLWGNSEDRARFLVLTTDIRTLVRERMAGRSSRIVSDYWRWLIPYVVAMIVLFGYQAFTSLQSDLNGVKHEQAVREYESMASEFERKMSEHDKASKDLDAKQLQVARELIADGSTDDKLTFLVQQVADEIELSQRTAYPGDYPKYPDIPDRPWWQESILINFAAAAVAWLLTYLVIRFMGRKPEAIFLIGGAVDRQQRIDKRRERLVWAVGVALIVGIASSVLASYLFGA